MSLESWKAEFYQLDADADAVQVDNVTRTRHSLQKWIGLRAENLEKHGLKASSDIIYEDDKPGVFRITGETCALCVRYINDLCEGCPLETQRNGVSCDNEIEDKETWSPYYMWTRDSKNPEPMIAALEATLQTLTNGNDNSVTTP